MIRIRHNFTVCVIATAFAIFVSTGSAKQIDASQVKPQSEIIAKEYNVFHRGDSAADIIPDFGRSFYNAPWYIRGALENSELIAGLITKFEDWMEEPGEHKRVTRDLSKQMKLGEWVKAYKKDPIKLQCIRKHACEAVAKSPTAAKSMDSPLSSAALSILGYLLNTGNELRDIVEYTIGYPEKCKEVFPYDFCEKSSYHNNDIPLN